MTAVEIAAPVWVDPAYRDRDAVRALVRDHSPYPLMMSSAGYGEMAQQHVEPWFRSHWALDGVAVDDTTHALLYYEPFVEAAKEMLGVAVVRPATLLVNIMGPQVAGAAVRTVARFFHGLHDQRERGRTDLSGRSESAADCGG